MLRKINIFLLLLITTLLIACKSGEKIEIELDLKNEELEVSNDYEAKLIVLKESFKIEVVLPGNGKKYNLIVNDKKIKDFKVNNNLLTYEFKGSDYLNNNDYANFKIYYDLAGGNLNSSELSLLNKHTTLLINAKDDAFSEEFTVFKKGQKGLRFHKKIFLKYDKDLNIYIPIYADYAEKSVEEIEVSDYDYIIGAHYYNEQPDNDVIIGNLFKDDVLNKVFVTDKDFYQEGTTMISIYDKDNLYMKYEANKNITLPDPKFDNVIFKGWVEDDKIIQNIDKVKVSDNLNFTKVVAKWENPGIEVLKDYLDTLIKTDLDKDINLPNSYAGYDISWESSNENILTNEGKFNTPYQFEEVKLKAKIKDLDGITSELEYKLNPKVKKDLSSNIASSYVYREYSKTNDYFYETLDIINTAFILADKDGNLNGLSYLSNVENHIMPKAKEYGNWVIMSVGPSSEWSAFSKDSKTVTNFANNIVNIINQYGFDGVDIDWETPRKGEEKQYTNLIKEVYEKVKANNPNHLVTTAITGGPYQPPMYDLTNSFKYLDYVNIMTYGMITNNGGYQNALYTSTSYHNQTYNLGRTLNKVSIHDSIPIFTNYGFEKSQLIIGVAFCGMRQVRTESGNYVASGSLDYNDIQSLLENENYEEYFDEAANVPYIIKKDGSEFYSYDNYRSILEKSIYAKEEKLGGVMFWEFAHDVNNNLLKAIKDGLNK